MLREASDLTGETMSEVRPAPQTPGVESRAIERRLRATAGTGHREGGAAVAALISSSTA
jgi:hypothetical protein